MQPRQGLGVAGDAAGSPDGGAVLLPTDVERRLVDRRLTPGPQVDPVVVHAAVPIQAAREPGPGELPDVEGEVVGALPCQRTRRITESVVEAATVGDGKAGRFPRERWRCITRCAEDHPLQPAGRIGADLRLGHAGFLEVLDVERVVAAHHPEQVGGSEPVGRGIGDAQQGDRPEHLGAQQRRRAGDRRPPVVTHDHGPVPTQSLDHPHAVPDQVDQAVGVHPGGALRRPVAPNVDRHGPVAGRRHRRKLVTPRVPRLREAVDEEHHRTLTHLGHVDTGTPCVHVMANQTLYLHHGVLPSVGFPILPCTQSRSR